MPANTRAQGLWQLLLGTLLGMLAPGSRASREQGTPAPDDEDVLNNGTRSGRFSQAAWAHPLGAAEKLHHVTAVLHLFKHLCGIVQDKCVHTTVVQLLHFLQLVVDCLQAAAKWSLRAVCVGLSAFAHLPRVGQSCIGCLIGAWIACSRLLRKHGLLVLAVVVIYVAMKLHGRQHHQESDGWKHLHQVGATALNNTSEGLLTIARISRESEALMSINTQALTSAADVAARYGMSGLSVAEGEKDQIRKDQVVFAVKRLHELASESRNLGRAERTLCMDTTFEYRNMTIKIGQLHFDVLFGLASGSPVVLAHMVQQAHGSLHDILDWAVREDGTYNKAKDLEQQRRKLARGLQSSSLELELLIPALPSLAEQHMSDAHRRTHEVDQLQLMADGASLSSTKHKLLKEKWEAGKTVLAHQKAHKQLTAAVASLRDMHNQITNGAIHDHMQMLSENHNESLISRESLLSFLENAKSVSVNPAFAQVLAGFLGDMGKAMDDAATKAISTCRGTKQLVGM